MTLKPGDPNSIEAVKKFFENDSDMEDVGDVEGDEVEEKEYEEEHEVDARMAARFRKGVDAEREKYQVHCTLGCSIH